MNWYSEEAHKKRMSQEQIACLKEATPDKLQYSLLPESSLKNIVKVFQYGARKYSPNNWMECKDPSMYYDAAMRHIGEWRDGYTYDKESRLRALSHAICSLIILDYLEEQKSKDNDLKVGYTGASNEVAGSYKSNGYAEGFSQVLSSTTIPGYSRALHKTD